MKKAAYAMTIVFASLIPIGCDSQPPPPAAVAPSQPDPAPQPTKNTRKPAARSRKLPGIHSPTSPTAPKAKF